jgi:hypothetical protein
MPSINIKDSTGIQEVSNTLGIVLPENAPWGVMTTSSVTGSVGWSWIPVASATALGPYASVASDNGFLLEEEGVYIVQFHVGAFNPGPEILKCLLAVAFDAATPTTFAAPSMGYNNAFTTGNPGVLFTATVIIDSTGINRRIRPCIYFKETSHVVNLAGGGKFCLIRLLQQNPSIIVNRGALISSNASGNLNLTPDGIGHVSGWQDKQDRSPIDNKIYGMTNGGLSELSGSSASFSILAENTGTGTEGSNILTIEETFFNNNDVFNIVWNGSQLRFNKADGNQTVTAVNTFGSLYSYTLNVTNRTVTAILLDLNAVRLTGAQTITGPKYFAPIDTNDKTSPVIIKGSRGWTYNEGIAIERFTADGSDTGTGSWSGILLGMRRNADPSSPLDPIGVNTTTPTPTGIAGNATWWIASNPSGNLEITQSANTGNGLTLARNGRIFYGNKDITDLLMGTGVIRLYSIDLGVRTDSASTCFYKAEPNKKDLCLTVKNNIAYLNGWVLLSGTYTGGTQISTDTLTIPNLYLPKVASQTYLMMNPVLDHGGTGAKAAAATGYMTTPSTTTGSTTLAFRSSPVTAGAYVEVFFNETWVIE